jgi:hypothetical protein
MTMSPLAVYAVSAHELYLAFREAGFTETQAIYLTSQRIISDARR